MDDTLSREAGRLPLTMPYAQVAVFTTDAAGRITACTNSLKELGLGLDGSPVGQLWESIFDAPSETQVGTQDGVQWSFFPSGEEPGQGYRVARYPMQGDRALPSGFCFVVEKVAPDGLNDRMLHYEKMFSLGETAASVAHEINNPLSVISGWLQLDLMQMPQDSPYRDVFEKMQREANRIAQVAANLLNFARRHPPQASLTNVNDVIAELVGFIEYQCRNENISIITALAPDLPHIRTDRNRLRQVLWNLVANARQAMPDGGQLTLSTRGGNSVEICVRDTGVGMSADVLERIFEPFFTTKQHSGGTGLGLSVSRSIIAALGGSISVQSQPGLGSVFTIELPITGSPSDDSERGE